MHIPPHNQMTELWRQHEVMRACDFGILITPSTEGLVVTHLPFALEAGVGTLGTLYGHVARANPHWKALASGRESLVIFNGPHAYISPTWYLEPEKRVPTWNYVAVHATGTVQIIDSDEAARDAIERIVAAHETDGAWSTALLDPRQRDSLMRGIVAFKISLTRIEGKEKLGQEKPDGDRLSVAGHLERGGETEMANLMRAVKSTV